MTAPRLCDHCQFLWHDLGVRHDANPGIRDQLRTATTLFCRLNHRRKKNR